MSSLNVQQALINLRSSIDYASRAFHEPHWDIGEPDWRIENCFLKLIALAEAMGLNDLGEFILRDYNAIRISGKGFAEVIKDPENDEPHPVYLIRAKQYLYAIEAFFPEERTKFTEDLVQILRNTIYTITNKALFGDVPKNERDLHLRIEGILRPVFPDLKHKPTITKPIKNFEPDTGIPSLRTLIEYKFLTNEENASLLAEQILADTRGYFSREWDFFVYVIYETHRLRSEHEWRNLLRDSDVSTHTKVVVLSGEPKKTSHRTKKKRK